jgi:hypothetical protein
MQAMNFAALFVLAVAVPAQTFVVDIANGPGTDFTSLAAATAAAPSGSVLRIRAGAYTGCAIDAKGLTLLADAGVVVAQTAAGGPAIDITNLAAGQDVVIDEVLVAASLANETVRCTNCQGAILIDSPLMASTSSELWILATNCDRLVLRDVVPAGAGTVNLRLNVVGCTTVLEQCVFGGVLITTTIVQQGGRLDLVDTTASAPWPLPTVQPPVILNGGELHLLGTSRVLGAYSSISGTGSVWIDAGVTTSLIVAPGVTAVVKPTSSLRTTFTGTALEATLKTPNGWFGAIAISLPGPRVQVPGMEDEVWLDGGSLQFLASGLMGPGTPVVASVPWSLGLLVGYPSMWQGVTFDPIDGLQVSNPSLLVLR